MAGIQEYVEGWMERAERFANSLRDRPASTVEFVREPAMTEAEIAEMCERLPRQMPEELLDCLRASRRFTLRYVVTCDAPTAERVFLDDRATRLAGGGTLCSPAEFSRLQQMFESLRNETAFGPSSRSLVATAIPFLDWQNSDCLAILPETGEVDYFGYADESDPLCANLPAFLAAWESVCYLWPNRWDCPKGRYWTPTADSSAQIRELFES